MESTSALVGSATIGIVAATALPGEVGAAVVAASFGATGGFVVQLYKSAQRGADPSWKLMLADTILSGFGGLVAFVAGVDAAAWAMNLLAAKGAQLFGVEEAPLLEPSPWLTMIAAFVSGTIIVWAYRKFVYEKLYANSVD